MNMQNLRCDGQIPFMFQINLKCFKIVGAFLGIIIHQVKETFMTECLFGFCLAEFLDYIAADDFMKGMAERTLFRLPVFQCDSGLAECVGQMKEIPERGALSDRIGAVGCKIFQPLLECRDGQMICGQVFHQPDHTAAYENTAVSK